MKKILLGTMLLLATAALAETVSSVSYNPSRLGDYQYLKVSDSAKLKGGLATQALNLNSGGNIRLTNDTTANSYTVGNITGAQENGMYMSNALWRNANTSGNSYAVSTTNPAGQIPTITVFGGTMNFSSDSFVNNLTAQNNNLYEYAGKLNVAGTMAVEGSPSSERNIVNAFGRDLNTMTSGIILGGKDIAYPKNVYYNDGAGNKGYTNIDLSGSNCKFEWVQRAVNSSTPSAVWVLALTGCEVTPICTPSAPVDTWQTDTCGPDNDPSWVGTRTRKKTTWTTCENGEEQYHESYTDWDESNCYKYAYKQIRDRHDAEVCSQLGEGACGTLAPNANPLWYPSYKEWYGTQSAWNTDSYCGNTWNECNCGPNHPNAKCMDVPTEEWGYGMMITKGNAFALTWPWGGICWVGNAKAWQCQKIPKAQYNANRSLYREESQLHKFTPGWPW